MIHKLPQSNLKSNGNGLLNLMAALKLQLIQNNVLVILFSYCRRQRYIDSGNRQS